MPTYEYECANGHHFEKIQKISDDTVVECPSCGADAQRLISGGAGLLFKGSGFYITDYRSDSYKEAAKKETAKRGTTAGSASSSSSEASSSSEPSTPPSEKKKKKESKQDSD